MAFMDWWGVEEAWAWQGADGFCVFFVCVLDKGWFVEVLAWDEG